MFEDFLMKGSGALAMPGDGMEGVFEIAEESLNVPTHMIETGQLGSGKEFVIQERGD